MSGIGTETRIFLDAVLAGIFVVSVYLSLRVVRRLVKHSLWVLNFEDMVYWIAMSIYLFVQIYYTSDGMLRWYFALGVVCGALLMLFLAFLLRKIEQKIYVLTRKKNGKSVDKFEKKR